MLNGSGFPNLMKEPQDKTNTENSENPEGHGGKRDFLGKSESKGVPEEVFSSSPLYPFLHLRYS